MARFAVAALGCALLAGQAGCSGLLGTRVERSDVTWKPFVIAHIADPALGSPGAEERLRRSAARLAGERYLEAIIVSGDLGDAPEAGAKVADVLRSSRRPLFIASASGGIAGSGGDAIGSESPVRGLRLLSATTGSPAPAAETIRALSGPVRSALAGVRGEFAVLALDWPPIKPGDGTEGSAAAGFCYVLEVAENLRLVVCPGVEDRLVRRGGLIYLITPPLSAGAVRLIDVKKHRVRTWLRPLAEGAADGPVTQSKAR